MLSRNPVSAAVALLIVCLASPAGAQNLEAGKTPSQIFSQTCSLCHKSSRGLLKTVPPGSLPGFLRQHYTTSTTMASMLSAYLLSNGATDTRLGGDNLTKQGKEARTAPGPASPEPRHSEPKPTSVGGLLEGLFESKPAETKPAPAESKPEPKPEPKPERRTREASRPDVDGLENIQPPPASETGAPEGQQSGKKQRLDKRKSTVSTVKQEQNIEPSTPSKPAESARTEPGELKQEPQIRSEPANAATPEPAAETPQKTAEGKPSNMPVFNLEPPPAETVPNAPPRPPAGPPVVPISQ
ncbi:MAG: hypothetical protein EKK40_06565 [Bradyrhizobiaceae bacterium]|nr:MAG: hypothetical protein EKK40_06565 [Bradyrhizobiaceae bacterium]